jgi:hypothetical protein
MKVIPLTREQIERLNLLKELETKYSREMKEAITLRMQFLSGIVAGAADEKAEWTISEDGQYIIIGKGGQYFGGAGR